MEEEKILPIGIEDFKEIRTQGYYYADKTGMIRNLLKNRSKVTLFTRPRRFDKSLNMSMLANFFSPDGDKSIFDGLEISKEKELCEKYMEKYPVIFLSLKSIEALDYEKAYLVGVQLIRKIARKYSFLLNSEKLIDEDKAAYRALLSPDMPEHVFS